ncbi:MAG: crotonase/enoyl-CoA hydratase family protein [Acetobacteraceae bacterium]
MLFLDTKGTGSLPSVVRPFGDGGADGGTTQPVPIRIGLAAQLDPLSGATPAAVVASRSFADIDVSITDEDRAFWCFMKPRGRPSFTPGLLRDLAQMQALIDTLFIGAETVRPFDYFVLASRSCGVFNLGGDLGLFSEMIREQDRDGLRRYAHACVRSGYANYTGYGHGVVTIALIQGDALGGGWEAPLSCDVMIAERQAKFGLPEILFNLFPGMGAYSFLSRRIGSAKAEEMILSGRVYTATEMHAIGLVDVLVEEGQGERAVRDYIARNRARLRAQSAIYQVRRRVNPIQIEELLDVTDLWVDTALGMSEQDLRRMGRIAAAQQRAIGNGFAPRQAARH